MSNVSFANDIRPLFTQDDINHMRFRFDLSSRDDNQKFASVILNRLKGIGGRVMPPPPAAPWPQTQIDLYQQWIDGGYQP